MKKIKPKKRPFSWMNPLLEVQNTAKYKRGVFAAKNLKKGSILAIFGGYIMNAEEELSFPSYMNDYGLQISENLTLGIIKKSEIFDTDYFNHSCDPNAGFGGQIFLIAMRNIKKGEEVTFDYAMVLHKSKGRCVYKIKCLCDSKECRGFISDYDWKRPEVQKKYDGYFQWYLQEKINKSRNK
jgi:uncharacterized protein